MKQTYELVSDLKKEHPEDETGWVIQFSDTLTAEELMDIGLEVWEKLEIPSLCIHTNHQLVFANYSKENDETTYEKLTAILDQEMKRLS